MRADGLWIYLGSGDMARPSETVATLRACGAIGALVLVESVDGRRQPLARVAAMVDALAAADVSAILYSFPSVTGDLYASRIHLAKCAALTGAGTQLDAEPHDGTHWSPALLAPWLSAFSALSITSTRAELPYLGEHGRETWLQAEAQTSIDVLPKSLRKWPRALVVTGAFGSEADPRTHAEFARDLARCQAQARKTGAHAVWSAASLRVRPDLCDEIRAWVVATWPAP